MSLPTNERYVIFLLPKYFTKSFFNKIYQRILNSLENKGVLVFNIKETIKKLKDIQNPKISFDKKPYPDINQLYIHLFNGQYYSDHIYNKKRIEKEREMLLLLAGKLGVKEINYKTEVIETTLTKMNGGINIKNIDNSINFSKNVSRNIGICGKEIYENRGAPVYLKFNSIKDVEENIKIKLGSMESNVFSFDYYKQNPKLESFVYKRFEFKMSKLEYTIESDDISDISFAIKSCFMDWGLSYSFDKATTFTEKITYTLEFFSDDELKLAYNKILFEKERENFDPFYSIREIYEAHDSKDTAVHIICEFVLKEAKKIYYKENSDSNKIFDFYKKLREWINDNQDGTFEGICHEFRSSSQIRTWLYKNLLKNDEEIYFNDTSPNKINSLVNFNQSKNIFELTQKVMYKNNLFQKNQINNLIENNKENLKDENNKENLKDENNKENLKDENNKENLKDENNKENLKDENNKENLKDENNKENLKDENNKENLKDENNKGNLNDENNKENLKDENNKENLKDENNKENLKDELNESKDEKDIINLKI